MRFSRSWGASARMKTLGLLSLLLLAALPASAQAVRDSAGIQIVEISNAALGATERHVLDGPPTLRIGVVAGAPEYQFSRIAGVVLSPDGSITVADGGSSQIRTFDASGTFVGSYGSQGEGPGEFLFLNWVGRCQGRIVAYDVRLGRLTEVGSSPANTWPLESGAGVPSPSWIRCADSGVVGVRQTLPTGVPSEGPMRGKATVQFFAPDLEWLANTEITGEERYFLGGNAFPRPLGRRTAMAASGDRVAVGTQDDPEVTFVDRHGAVVRILRWPRQHLEIRSDDIESYVNGLVDASPDRAEGIRAMYRDLEFPDVLPAFGSLLLDEGGRLWVEQTQRPGNPANAWTVFSESGTPLWVVDFPERFIPHVIDTNRVAGVWRDDLNVEHVWVLETNFPGRDDP